MKKNCSCSRWYIYIYIYTERCGLFIRFNPTHIYHINSKVVVSGQLFLLPEMTSRIWIVALMSLYWWGLALFKFKKWWLEVGFDSLFQTWTCKRGKRKRWVIVDECPFPNWKENTEKFRVFFFKVVTMVMGMPYPSCDYMWVRGDCNFWGPIIEIFACVVWI